MNKNLSYFFGLIAFVAAPTVATLGYSVVSGDSSFRPLGATVDNLRLLIAGEDIIVVTVKYGSHNRSGISHGQVEQTLRAAFDAKGIDALVMIHEAPGSKHIKVTYEVGKSHFGPMLYRQTPKAVKGVVAAYRMAQNG